VKLGRRSVLVVGMLIMSIGWSVACIEPQRMLIPDGSNGSEVSPPDTEVPPPDTEVRPPDTDVVGPEDIVPLMMLWPIQRL